MTEPTTTWADIKLATLQKMFSANGTSIQPDSSISEYIYGMPQAANEALQLLSTAGKFLIGQYVYINHPIEPILGISYNQFVTSTASFAAPGAKSYYFKARGKLAVTIAVDGTTVSTITINHNDYRPYTGLITNPDNADVVLTVTANSTGDIDNLAFYDVAFDRVEEIPPYEEYIRIPMAEVLDDFYQLEPTQLYRENDGNPEYLVASEFWQEAGKLLIIPRSKPGTYTIYYRRYPPRITMATDDDYILPVDPEVAAIMPLYMASQLYKDDDNSIATTYRNEFEVARDALSQWASVGQKEQFVSETGWV